jgi:hypothetical protein
MRLLSPILGYVDFRHLMFLGLYGISFRKYENQGKVQGRIIEDNWVIPQTYQHFRFKYEA